MVNSYDLWDVESGNNLGHFASEAEAYERVRALLDAYGNSYAADLHLGGHDEHGQIRPALTGPVLARRARQADAVLHGA